MKLRHHKDSARWKSSFKSSVLLFGLVFSLLLPIICNAQRVNRHATDARNSRGLPATQVAVNRIGSDRNKRTASNNHFVNCVTAFRTDCSTFTESSSTRSEDRDSISLLSGDNQSAAPLLALTMADFTGDSHPDLATVGLDELDSANGHYSIDIHLTEGGRQSLRLTAPFGRLLISAIDVTDDGNLDLVVRTAWSQVPVAVFLNDGHGHFSSAKRPDRYPDAYQAISSESAFVTEHQPFAPTLAFSESYTTKRDSGWLHSVPANSCPRSSTKDLAPRDSFLHFGSNRAPPTIV